MLALAVSGVLAGSAYGGQEVADTGYKQPQIEAPAPTFGGSVSAGYWSKYIFRGTNLTPGSDGLIWSEARVHFQPWEGGTFTFGMWAGSQLGSAQVPGSERIGESGGGAVQAGDINRSGGSDFSPQGRVSTGNGPGTLASPQQQAAITNAYNRAFPNNSAISGDDLVDFLTTNFNILGAPVTRQDVNAIIARDLPTYGEMSGGVPQQITRIKTTNTAIQNRFTEIDAYVEYRHDFGPVEVAVGNIFFYIDRDSTSVSTTQEFYASEDARDLVTQLSKTYLNAPTASGPAIPIRADKPEDLLLNGGKKVTTRLNSTGDEMFDRIYGEISTNMIPYIKPRLVYYQTVYNWGDSGDTLLTTNRYDTEGGYLEFKIDGYIPLIKETTHQVTDYKTGVTSGGEDFVKVALNPHFRVSYSFLDRAQENGQGLDGWNHIQIGTELVWNVTETFRVVPEVNYMNHLSAPPPGTDWNTWWAGGRVEVIF